MKSTFKRQSGYFQYGKRYGKGLYMNELKDSIFRPYNKERAFKRNAVEYHAMTGGHTEILGQFIDYTAIDEEELKDILIRGYIDRTKMNQ